MSATDCDDTITTATRRRFAIHALSVVVGAFIALFVISLIAGLVRRA